MEEHLCHRGGIDWGVYYSQPDWHHPDYRNGAAHAKYIEYLHGQVRELLTNYGKTGMWFFDGLDGVAADWDAPRLIRMMRQLQPDLVINDRAGIPADYDTPDRAGDRHVPKQPAMGDLRHRRPAVGVQPGRHPASY